jgi:hypothetical protein
MTTKERSWTTILINRPFQLKLLAYFLAFFALITTSLYSTTYLFYLNLKNKGLNVGIPEDHAYFQFLIHQKHDLDLLFIGLAIFNLVVLIVMVIILSHRIAGPLHKFKQLLESPDAVDKIKLRENDFFHEIVPLINKLKEKIK